jgi:hypothetical protein
LIVEFVLTSFATVIGWEMLRSLVWFHIPPRLGPFLVTAVAYGTTFLTHPSVLIALAATGGVAVLHKIIDTDPVDPVVIRRPQFRRKRPSLPGYGRRIPGL